MGLEPVGPTECRSFLAEYKISRHCPFKAERKGGVIGWMGLVPVGPAECQSCSLQSIKSYVTVSLRLKGKGAYNWVDGIGTCLAC